MLRHTLFKFYSNVLHYLTHYLQPERIKGEDYSVHSEVWSLGVSLFEVSQRFHVLCGYKFQKMIMSKNEDENFFMKVWLI